LAFGVFDRSIEMTLKDLQVGDRAKVVGFLDGGGAYRRKLLSMGLTPGAEISVTRVAPMGDPVEIRVRGFSLSVRRDEAATLSVERL
jgi:ferrous iron transport protein A